MQSPRPYTTYELDQIRQFQKRLTPSLEDKIQCIRLFIVNSIVMNSVVVWPMFIRLFDNVVVLTQ